MGLSDLLEQKWKEAEARVEASKWMEPEEARALGQKSLTKAEKKVHSSAGWMESQGAVYEEAGDLYNKAARTFASGRLYRESGDAFARQAECHDKGGERDDAAHAWWNAAKAYKHGNPNLAVQALSQTTVFLTMLDRFRLAADREKETGQIYLQMGDVRKAAESYDRAAEWYSQEDATATANSCKKDAADLYAELDDWQAAIKRYDEVAQHSLGSQLTKYNVKEYWLRAGLCALAAQDAVTARKKLGGYFTTDTTFSSTREAKFLLALIEAVEKGDQEAFTGAVEGYDQVQKLDNWKTEVLLKIRKGIQEEEPGIL